MSSQAPISGPSFMTGDQRHDVEAMKREIVRLQEQVRAILGIQGSAHFQKPLSAPQSANPPDSELATVGYIKKKISEISGTTS